MDECHRHANVEQQYSLHSRYDVQSAVDLPRELASMNSIDDGHSRWNSRWNSWDVH